MGRANDAAFLGSSAGARFITTRSCGRWKPEFTIARSTRCVLSLTAAWAARRESSWAAWRGRDVDFYIDEYGFNSQERKRMQFGQHAVTSRWPAFLSASRVHCAPSSPALQAPADPQPCHRVAYTCHRQHVLHCLLASSADVGHGLFGLQATEAVTAGESRRCGTAPGCRGPGDRAAPSRRRLAAAPPSWARPRREYGPESARRCAAR